LAQAERLAAGQGGPLVLVHFCLPRFFCIPLLAGKL